MKPKLKTIVYRGGVITFRIPDHWQEEYGEDGGGCFYEDSPESTTLRLDVLTAKAPITLTSQSAPDVLVALSEFSSDCIEKLPDGRALTRHTQSAEQQGERLHITFWTIAQVVSSTHARIATFSHTMLDRQKDEIQFQQELELIDNEIRSSIFSPELGV